MKIQMVLETAYARLKMPALPKIMKCNGEGWHVTNAVAGREWAAVEVTVTRRDWTPDVALLFVTLGLESLCPDGLECTRADVDGKPLELS
ncbi:hypothetical protein ACINK0_11490 [Deinococcus sp. VB343]|uniref:hypothetical protein n=1 Tax=Deinococcus sp. VB343 TaxID=3385567 RepID=UPI0039C96A41